MQDARADDLPALAALTAHAAVAPFLSPVTAERFAAAADDPLQRVLAIRADGALAGGLRLDLTRWDRHRAAEVHTFMLDPAMRGRGIAVAALRELLAALGAHRVQAEAYGFNTAAVRTFTAAGFVQEGVRRRAWFRDGEWRDGVLLGWVEPD